MLDPRRRAEFDDVTLTRFHQGSGDRSQPAHLAAVEIGLVDTDDRDRHFGPAPGGVGDGRAEKDLVQLPLLVWVDHLGTLQPLGQEADAPINLAQAALTADVVAVLRAVAPPLSDVPPAIAGAIRPACGGGLPGLCSS